MAGSQQALVVRGGIGGMSTAIALKGPVAPDRMGSATGVRGEPI